MKWLRYLVPPPAHKDSRRPIVVVDERTYRHARKAVDAAKDAGEVLRAYEGLTAMRLWLRREIFTGRRSKRAGRARRLELVELEMEPLIRELTGAGR